MMHNVFDDVFDGRGQDAQRHDHALSDALGRVEGACMRGESPAPRKIQDTRYLTPHAQHAVLTAARRHVLQILE